MFLRGDRRRKTVQDRLYYLKVALRDNQFVLDAPRLDDYIMEEAQESIDRTIHIAIAPKLFLKIVVKSKEPGKRRKRLPRALKILHEKEKQL